MQREPVKEMQLRKNMLVVSLLGVVLTSGCALGSNAPGRAAGAVKDGARRETIRNVASENFTQQLYGPGAIGAATPTAVARVDPTGIQVETSVEFHLAKSNPANQPILWLSLTQ